jgi:Amt family ammonium transporter
MISRSWDVCATLVWSGVARPTRSSTFIVGLRANVETEREGLDITEHTERAYNM